MYSNSKNQDQIKHLENQLGIARREINNLRKQINALKLIHQKECNGIKEELRNWRCCGCKNTSSEQPKKDFDAPIPMREIGVIATKFPEKRGTPRQATICSDAIAKLTLSYDVFTNPEHALQGLEEFSHMWLLFHFHKNNSTHTKAKVSPPRLNGDKIGVFATRSPHRPSPIGLSLVTIDKIEGNSIYFYGVDVVDGTPVLDIKPYLPQYDKPHIGCENLLCLSTETGHAVEKVQQRSEESSANRVRVAQWTEHSVNRYHVVFEESVLAQLEDKSVKSDIENVLREDPRSVYLRERWTGHSYTFPISNIHVSCKFDDETRTVSVYQIRESTST